MVEGSRLISVGARGGDRGSATFDGDLKLLSDAENGSRIQTVGGVEFVERDIGAFRYRPEVITFFNRVSLKRGARDWDGLTSIGEGCNRSNRVKLTKIITLWRYAAIFKTSIEGAA